MLTLAKVYPSGSIRYLRYDRATRSPYAIFSLTSPSGQDITPCGQSQVAGEKGPDLIVIFRDGGMADNYRCHMIAHDDRAMRGEYKWTIRPYDDGGAWKNRERNRLKSGEYMPVVWAGESWFKGAEASKNHLAKNHFLHVSKNAPEMVAYTPDKAHGVQDRQSRLRPGAYLKRFFGDVLDSRQIADWSARHMAKFDSTEFAIASDPDAIASVYADGPTSCMSGDWTRPIGRGNYSRYRPEDWTDYPVKNPAYVYGAGDLGVAYIRRGGRITARCLVRLNNPRAVGLIYGDGERLKPKLREAGYTGYPGEDFCAFDGARLLKIPYRNSHVMPYIDGFDYIEDDGEHFVIGGGDIFAQETCGICRDNRIMCASCEEYFDRNDVVYVRGANSFWCDHCVDSDAFRCDVNGEYYPQDQLVEMADGSTWSRNAFQFHGATCEATGEHFRTTETVLLETGERWSLEHFEANGFECDDGHFWPSREACERHHAIVNGQRDLLTGDNEASTTTI